MPYPADIPATLLQVALPMARLSGTSANQFLISQITGRILTTSATGGFNTASFQSSSRLVRNECQFAIPIKFGADNPVGWNVQFNVDVTVLRAVANGGPSWADTNLLLYATGPAVLANTPFIARLGGIAGERIVLPAETILETDWVGIRVTRIFATSTYFGSLTMGETLSLAFTRSTDAQGGIA